MAKPENKGPKLRFVDRPEVRETFADSIRDASYDGQTLRLELCVTRLDGVQTGVALSGQQFPVARLVLSPAATKQLVDDLANMQKGIMEAQAMAEMPATKPN